MKTDDEKYIKIIKTGEKLSYSTNGFTDMEILGMLAYYKDLHQVLMMQKHEKEISEQLNFKNKTKTEGK